MTRRSRRSRPKARKPKYLSLRRHLAPPQPPAATAAPSDPAPAPPEEQSASSSCDMPSSSSSGAVTVAGAGEGEDRSKSPQQMEPSPLQPTDHLDRDPHVASLLLLDDGNRSIAALFGDDGAAASSGSPASAAEDSPTSSSMNWDGLARRALRGRERWAYCHSSSLPAASSSGDEEASSAGGGAGDRVADPWWRFAGTSGRTQTLALKLDYDEILVAWSDRGPLYIEGDSPQVVPWHNGACGKPYYAFPVMVEVGPNEAWRMPEIMDGEAAAAAAAALDSRTTAEGEEERSRKEKVRRYKEKRRSRLFAKRIRYEVRKQNAEKRPRFKGRFVKQESW